MNLRLLKCMLTPVICTERYKHMQKKKGHGCVGANKSNFWNSHKWLHPSKCLKRHWLTSCNTLTTGYRLVGQHSERHKRTLCYTESSRSFHYAQASCNLAIWNWKMQPWQLKCCTADKLFWCLATNKEVTAASDSRKCLLDMHCRPGSSCPGTDSC